MAETQNTQTSLLEVVGLRKKYGKATAVDDISFSVPKGQFFGFLGPNGAGKSTTIQCITGTARITEGTITVAGVDVVSEYREARKRIGVSPQEFNTDIFLNARQILDFVGGYYGISKKARSEKIDTLLEQFELIEHAHKPFQALSGGLKRRVILARALIHDPDLLILDEPTAGVDVEQRHDLWRYFKELSKQGKTILLTSHYLEEVEILCDRIAIIHKGKLIADKPKADFIQGGTKLEEQYLKITREAEEQTV
ncbi:ABC transporter ATP-binding protein [Candidatus Kaiserbacteria bacterium]|nr:ABC transporter ATP-binding protein [Candidatus Kaiserbacteria bacterium]